MTTQKYGLAIVANPYATVCLIVVDDAGQPVLSRLKAWTGKWDSSGRPVHKGYCEKAETYDPHQSGGTYDTTQYTMVDGTPRSWDEALALALRCPADNHSAAPITVEKARALIAAGDGQTVR